MSGPVGANGAEDTIELQNNDDTIDYFLWSQDLFVLYNDESVKTAETFEVQRQLQADHSGKRLQRPSAKNLLLTAVLLRFRRLPSRWTQSAAQPAVLLPAAPPAPAADTLYLVQFLFK